ncbi:Ig-like domain-containing protein [Acidovorax cavernicola]
MFTKRDVTHKTEGRNPSVIDSNKESFYGTDGDDVVTMSTDMHAYFKGALSGKARAFAPIRFHFFPKQRHKSFMTSRPTKFVVDQQAQNIDDAVALQGQADPVRGSEIFELPLKTPTTGEPVGVQTADAGAIAFAHPPAVIEQVVDAHGATKGPIESGGYTDDSRPTISGKAEAGVWVNVYDGNEVMGRVQANANGDWSLSPSLPLKGGEHQLSVTHQYPSGELVVGTEVHVIFIDKIAPDMPVVLSIEDDQGRITDPITHGGVTDDNKPVITGKAERFATVIVYDKGVEIAREVADEDGNWRFTPDTPLADGLHILNFAAVDRAGNMSEDTQKIEFTVDTRPEKVNIYGAEDDAGDVTGTVASGGITDDATPMLFGTATAGGLVTIYEGDVVIGRVTADVDGTWELTPEVALSEGKHTFQATVTLPAKGESERSKPFVLNVDTKLPEKPTIDGAYDDVGNVTGHLSSGDETDDVLPVLSGTAEKNSLLVIKDKGVELGSVVVDSEGAWRFEPPVALSAGPHEFTVQAVDAAGNWSVPSDRFDLTVFTAPLAAPVIVDIQDDTGWMRGTVANGTGVSNDPQPVISGTAGAGERVTLRVHWGGEGEFVVVGTAVADPDGHWSIEDKTSHVDGRVRYEATAITPKGELTATSDAYEITFDFIAPPVPTSLVIDADAVTVGFDAGTLKVGDMVVLSVDGVLRQHVLTPHELAQGNCTFAVAGARTKRISAGLMDAAGNASNHVAQVENFIDFEAMTPMRVSAPSTLDLGPVTMHWSGSELGKQPTWPAGIIEKGFRTGEGFITPSIGMGVWGGNYLTLDDGKSSNYFSMTYGELTNSMNVVFMDSKGAVIHTVNAPLTGGPGQAEFSTTLPAGLAYTKVLFSTHVGQYVWIDNLHFGASGLHEIAAPDPYESRVASFENHNGDVFADGSVLSDPTHACTAGDDQIIARLGFADRLRGGAGNDTVRNVGTGDTVHAGSGDDIVRINSTDFAQVNGGLGIDTLVMDGKAMHIDLSAAGLKVQGFEKFDLGAGGNALSLSTDDVLAGGARDMVTADGKVQMLVNGADGEVNLIGGNADWTGSGSTTVSGVTYEVYTNLAGTAELLVEDKVHVTIL